MSNDNFWNDDRVKEFVRAITAIDQRTYLDNKITEFKASNTSSKEEVGWEILEGCGSGGEVHKWFPDSSQGGASPCIQMNCAIHSVRRKIDSEIFSVGDEIKQGTIASIEKYSDSIYVHCNAGEVTARISLAYIQPLPKIERPPLGLLPTKFWKIARLNEIENAIIRFVNARREIPPAWIKERDKLLEWVKSPDINNEWGII